MGFPGQFLTNENGNEREWNANEDEATRQTDEGGARRGRGQKGAGLVP